jgi:hypothetical protein
MILNIHYTDKSKGIYVIKNNITNQIYIGSTRNTLYNRLRLHIQKLRKNQHHNIKLQRSYNKYGENNFSIFLKKLNYDDRNILIFEEKFISIYKPYYNICLFPTKGGKPNFNRKFDKKWKQNLNRDYKHSVDVKEIVSQNNKNNACKLLFTNENLILNFQSWREAGQYFNCKENTIMVSYKRYGKYKNFNIQKLSNQTKKVKLYYNNEIKIFNCANDCDSFFKIWRGATSFYLNRDNKIKEFKVEYID